MKPLENPAILIMAKWPAPGQVKTRLVPLLSPEEAAELYRAMLLDAAGRSLEVEGFTVLAGFYPPERRADFEKLLPGVGGFIAQEGAHLAARMGRCFDAAFSVGYAPVLMRNSDAPTLPPRILCGVLGKLREGADAAFSPDASNGYGIVGLRAPVPGLFEEPLQSADSYAATRARCTQLKLRTAEAEGWYDVDTPRDLARLLEEWRAGSTGSNVTRFLSERGEQWRKRLQGAVAASDP